MRPVVFVLVAAGVCLGLSDVWRFPYLVQEHGSAWFPVLYAAALVLVGAPLLVGELALARMGYSRPATNFGFLARDTEASPLWQYVGIIILITVCLILFYTTVVAGWMMAYAVRAFSGGLGDLSEGAARLMFHSLVTDPERLLGWHTLFVLLLGWVALKGVNAGVGSVNRRLVAGILAIGAVLAGASLAAYGAGSLWALDWSLQKLSGALVLDAVTQAFFTLGVCMGAMMVLGTYLSTEAKLGPVALSVIGIDLLFVLLASAGAVPLLASREAGAGGISFAVETVPVALSTVPLGGAYLTAFYLLLFLLVATTALVLMECLVAWLCEKTGKPRASIVPVLAAVVWFAGLVPLLSFSAWSFEFEFVGREKSFGLFDVMDILSSQILLPIVGFLMAVFVGWNIDRNNFEDVVGLGRAASAIHYLKRYLVPVLMAVVFLSLVFSRVLTRV